MRILIYFSIVLILLGCTEPKKDYSVCYESIGEQFDFLKYNHFPDTLVNLKFRFKLFPPEQTKENRSCGAFLAAQLSNEDLQKLEESIKDSTIAEYKPSDICILEVNLLLGQEAGNVFLEHYNKQCEDPYIPIPNFRNLLRGTPMIEFHEHGRLSDNFSINVLDAKQGAFIDNDNLTEGIGLPEKWKNGYTKGIAINKKSNIVIYWFEVW